MSITIVNPRPLKRYLSFPCVYLSLTEGRLIRKVYNIKNGFEEWIDSFE